MLGISSTVGSGSNSTSRQAPAAATVVMAARKPPPADLAVTRAFHSLLARGRFGQARFYAESAGVPTVRRIDMSRNYLWESDRIARDTFWDEWPPFCGWVRLVRTRTGARTDTLEAAMYKLLADGGASRASRSTDTGAPIRGSASIQQCRGSLKTYKLRTKKCVL